MTCFRRKKDWSCFPESHGFTIYHLFPPNSSQYIYIYLYQAYPTNSMFQPYTIFIGSYLLIPIPPIDLCQISQQLHNTNSHIWVNYNDLTVLPHWESWLMMGSHPLYGLNSGWWNIGIFPNFVIQVMKNIYNTNPPIYVVDMFISHLPSGILT